MKKFVLIIILSILALSFLAFFLKVFNLQKDYFNNKNNQTSTENTDNSEIKDKPSSYADYSKSEFDKAIVENRVIVLFFTSNWCSECTSQDAINSEVFTDLSTSSLVGLRSHILDSETTTETDALSKKFDVTKENTVVMLNKKGAVAFKNVGMFEKEALKTKILEVGDIQ